MAALRILLLTFTSRFVIDFLSIRKVIIFSAIATNDRQPLQSRSIHQNAANCMTIHFRYIAQPRGVRKTYSLVARPFYARGARWERDKDLVPVVRACVKFYWNPGKIVFFGIF